MLRVKALVWVTELGARARRHPVLTASLVLLLAARVAVPFLLRPYVADRASRAIEGHVEIGDIDLYLLQGGVALQEVSVFSGSSRAVPIVSWKDLYLRVSWIRLLTRSVRFREILLDSPRLNLKRFEDGELNLLALAGAGATEPEQPEDTDGDSWTVGVDRLALRSGSIAFRDLQVGSTEPVNLGIAHFQVERLAVQGDVYSRPGRVRLEMRLDGGSLQLTGRLRRSTEGLRVRAALRGENLPIGHTRFYVPGVGWSVLRGRLDVSGRYSSSPGARDELQGLVAMREVIAEVPGMDLPAIRWEALEIDVEGIDLLNHQARVRSIDLKEVLVGVDLVGPMILPVLPEIQPETGAAGGKGKPLSKASASAIPEDAISGAAPAHGDSPDRRPWRWSVGSLKVRDGHIMVAGKGETLDVGVRLSSRNLGNEGQGDPSPIEIEVREGAGLLTATGSLRVEPTELTATIGWADFSLPRLLATAGLEVAHLLRKGTTRGELKIAAASEDPDKSREANGPGSSMTLRVGGSVQIDEVLLSGDDPKTFSSAWKTLRFDIEEASLKNAASSSGGPGLPGSVVVKLDQIALDEPVVMLTRTAEGMVIPVALGGSQSTRTEAKAPPGVTQPSPAVTTASSEAGEEHAGRGGRGASASTKDGAAHPHRPARVRVLVGTLRVDKGKLGLEDGAVNPPFHGGLSEVSLTAHDLAWPELRVGGASLSAVGAQKEPIVVSCSIEPDGLRAELKGERLALVPFDSYATTFSAYSIPQGTGSITSKIQVAEDRYQTDNEIVLHDLRVETRGGEHVFRDQFGIPLSLALALMRDPKGDISLEVPITGDLRGAKVNLLAIIGGAFRQAVANAVVSPLKLVGMVKLSEGRVEGFSVEPIRFHPGESLLTPEGEAHVKRLGELLADRPGLIVTLDASIAAADLRWLREQDLIGEIRQQGSAIEIPDESARKGVREEIRAHLEKRAAGEKAMLSAEAERVLQALLSERALSTARLRLLAQERTLHVREHLEVIGRIEAQRIEVKEPTGGETEGDPAVLVDILPAS